MNEYAALNLKDTLITSITSLNTRK